MQCCPLHLYLSSGCCRSVCPRNTGVRCRGNAGVLVGVGFYRWLSAADWRIVRLNGGTLSFCCCWWCVIMRVIRSRLPAMGSAQPSIGARAVAVWWCGGALAAGGRTAMGVDWLVVGAPRTHAPRTPHRTHARTAARAHARAARARAAPAHAPAASRACA